MNGQMSQANTAAAYEGNNSAALQNQMLMRIASAQQQNVPTPGSYIHAPNPYVQRTAPGYVPTPIYDMSNPYRNQEAVAQSQIDVLQENIKEQNRLRALTQQGRLGVSEAVRLYKNLGKSPITDKVTSLPGLSYFSPKKYDKIQTSAAMAAGRSPDIYKQGFASIAGTRQIQSAKEATLKLGQEALLDYITGKLIMNSPNVDPTLSADSLYASSRTRAENILDFYTETLLKNKKVTSEKDIERLLQFVDGSGGASPDVNETAAYLDKMEQLAGERAVVEDYIAFRQQQFKDVEKNAVAEIRDKGVGGGEWDGTLISPSKIFMAQDKSEAIGYMANFLGSLVKGAGKEIGIGAHYFLDILGRGIGIADVARTNDFSTLDKAKDFSAEMRAMLEPDSNEAGEIISTTGLKLFFAYGLGAALLPSVGIAGATLAGAGVSYVGGPIVKSTLGAIFDAFGSILFNNEEDNKYRRLYDEITSLVTDASMVFFLNKGLQYANKGKAGTFTEAMKKTDQYASLPSTLQKQLDNITQHLSLADLQTAQAAVEGMDFANIQTPMGTALALNDLMDLYPQHREATSLNTALQNAALEAGTAYFHDLWKEYSSTPLLEIPNATKKLIGEKLAATKVAHDKKYQMTLDSAFRGKSLRLGELFSGDIIERVRASPELYPEVTRAYQSGIADLIRQDLIPVDIGMKLMRTIIKEPSTFDQIINTNSISAEAAHWIKVKINAELQGQLNSKSSVSMLYDAKESVDSTIRRALDEQGRKQYSAANNFHRIYMDFTDTLQKHVDENNMVQDAVTIRNALPQITQRLSEIEGDMINAGLDNDIILNMSEFISQLSGNVMLETLNLRDKSTAEKISTLRSIFSELPGVNKHANHIFNQTLSLIENLIGRSTKGHGRSASGSYMDAITAASNLLLNYIGGYMGPVKGVLSSMFKKKELPTLPYDLGRILDILYENRGLSKMVDVILNDNKLNRTIIAEGLGYYAALQGDRDEDEAV